MCGFDALQYSGPGPDYTGVQTEFFCVCVCSLHWNINRIIFSRRNFSGVWPCRIIIHSSLSLKKILPFYNNEFPVSSLACLYAGCNYYYWMVSRTCHIATYILRICTQMNCEYCSLNLYSSLTATAKFVRDKKNGSQAISHSGEWYSMVIAGGMAWKWMSDCIDYLVQVFRNCKWSKMSSENLLPGDIMSIGTSVGCTTPIQHWHVILAVAVSVIV